ncbi:MAG: MFS transporter [Pseudomonadales bacterium]|jgi:predicted MFS family arabinose efflux permease|nr:MFS transporter [Pseudomonadales bacterium]
MIAQDPSTAQQEGVQATAPFRAWSMVLVIALCAAVAQAFGRFSYGLILPAMRDDLGISNAAAGAIGGANVGAYLIGTLAVAWATSRFRLLSVLRFGIVLATAGLVGAALSDSALLLGAALFVAGFGGACVWIPAPMIAADAVPTPRRGFAISLTGTGIGVGVVSASLFAAALRARFGDDAWNSVYVVEAATGVLTLLLLLALVRHAQAAPSGGGGIGGFGALQRMRGWRPILVAYSAFGFMYLLVFGFLTTRLEDDSGWTSQDAAFAFTLVGCAMVVGGPLFVAVAKRLGVRGALALGFGLWPLVTAIIWTGAALPTLLACFALGLLFGGTPLLITMYVVEHTTPTDYGPAFSAATLAFGVAQMVSPPIGGVIADVSGSFTLVFALSGATAVLGAGAALRLPSEPRV